MIARPAMSEARVLAALKTLLGFGLIAMVLLNVANAAGRYGGFQTFSGMDELLIFTMIWVVMVGAVLAVHDRTHLSITLIPARLGQPARHIHEIFLAIASAIVAGFVSWHSWSFIERIAAIGQKSMGLGVPMVVPHLAIFVGFAGIAVASLLLALSDIRMLRRGGAE